MLENQGSDLDRWVDNTYGLPSRDSEDQIVNVGKDFPEAVEGNFLDTLTPQAREQIEKQFGWIDGPVVPKSSGSEPSQG